MRSITYKGKPNPKNKKMVKLEMIFFKTGYNRVPKVLTITGEFKDWDQKNQCFKSKSVENQTKNRQLLDLALQYNQVVTRWEVEGVNWSPREWAHYFDEEVKEKEDLKVRSVVQMIDIIIEEFRTKQRYKNGKVVSSFANVKEYNLLKTSLQNFTKEKYGKNLSSYFFKDIKESFLNDYSIWLQLNGKKNGNGGAVLHRLKN